MKKASNWIRGFLYRKPTYEAFRSYVKSVHMTPKALCNEVSKFVRYRADPFERDQWQRAEETWKRGCGDCEDLAVLLQQLLEKLGIGTVMTVAFSPRARSGHVYLVPSDRDNADWVISNGVWIRLAGKDPVSKVISTIGWKRPVHVMTLWPETIESMLTKKGGVIA